MKYVLSLLLLLLLGACATDSPSPVHSKSAMKEIPVFRADHPPQNKYVVIRSLKDDAAEVEEDQIIEKFVQQARKLGGDALLLHEKSQSGMERVPFSFGKVNITFLFRADVIRFEQP